MNNLSRRDILFIIIGITFVIYSGFLIVEHIKNGPNKFNVTKFYSPVTKSNDTLIINYGGSADPNGDAVNTQYRVFDAAGLPKLSSYVKTLLPNLLPGYVQNYVLCLIKLLLFNQSGRQASLLHVST